MAECECCECVYHADDGCKCRCHPPICSVCDEEMSQWNEDDEGDLCCLKCEEEEARAEEDGDGFVICSKCGKGGGKCDGECETNPVAEK